MKQSYYSIRRPQIISEVFEDEVVAVNFDTGSYYGMAATAREVWNSLEAGMGDGDIAARLEARYEAPPGAIRADLAAFLSRLEEEKLVLPPAESGVAGIGGDGETPPHRGSWAAPVLSVYEDMQDLLLLDPIHDVDTSGWPVRKAPAAGE